VAVGDAIVCVSLAQMATVARRCAQPITVPEQFRLATRNPFASRRREAQLFRLTDCACQRDPPALRRAASAETSVYKIDDRESRVRAS
jgi:hypothetical protein